jgi:hypothetical protein
MTAAFNHSLRQSLATLNLNADIIRQLGSNLAMLGNLAAPSGPEKATALAIRSRIAEAFVFGFRLIAVLCAVLAIVSAVVAWWKMPSQTSRAVGSPSHT